MIYEELPPKGKWRFRLLEDLEFYHGEELPCNYSCMEGGREWLLLSRHSGIVRAGYAWDGCSPKVSRAGMWIGTPDFKETHEASCVHDALCQFHGHDVFPIPKAKIDEIFLDLMKDLGFLYAEAYYRAVRIFGELYGKRPWKEKSNNLSITLWLAQSNDTSF